MLLIAVISIYDYHQLLVKTFLHSAKKCIFLSRDSGTIVKYAHKISKCRLYRYRVIEFVNVLRFKCTLLVHKN